MPADRGADHAHRSKTRHGAIGANTELFGSIQNLFDRVPPFDPLTYGAIGYNPLDHSGAVGRFYTVGLRHNF